MGSPSPPSNKNETSSTNLANTGIGQLTAILQGHLDLMASKNEHVEKIINKEANAKDLLRDAKKKALENETSLLLSIMNDLGEMHSFLNNIVLIENLFIKVYVPYKQKQEAARAKYAKNIAKFENVKKKPYSEVSSFVELIFGGQTHIS